MRTLFQLLIVLLVISGLGAAVYQPAMSYWKGRYRPHYRTAEVTRGRVVSVVNSTGTVKPVLSVQVGSFVSGPIESLFVDFNDEVKKDQLLAKIDPRLYESNVARDKAILATRRADVQRVQALLQQAKNNEIRAQALRDENKDFISDSEMDKFKFERMSLEAQQIVAEASVEEAMASLANAEANLGYTEIRSPVDGIIIDRKIDPGQTLAAQFQTPELFIVAPDMRKEMYIFASVDEADIGFIRKAQLGGKLVQFTVDAYPDDLFDGKIFQIRKSSTTTQNVVTYPVVVSAPNPELKLLPGMTASLSFQIDEVDDTLRIPNAALRFYPKREQVRPEDEKLLEGTEESSEDEEERVDAVTSAPDKAEARRQRNRRHVWIEDGLRLKAVEVTTGLSDSKYTQLVSGELDEGQQLVTGLQPRK